MIYVGNDHHPRRVNRGQRHFITVENHLGHVNLVECEANFERMTAEEDEDDGDEDDCQTGLSLLPDGALEATYGFQSDCQVNPDVEIEEDDPRHHHCHQQLQVLLVYLIV